MDYSDLHNLTQRYNQIKFLDEQSDWLPKASFQRALDSIAQIFVRHQAHFNFAIALLHRHYDLRPGFAMVHSRGSASEDRCDMELIGTRRIFPCAYRYCDATMDFLPYEFSTVSLPVPDKVFLAELAAFLHQCNLYDLIAITHVDSRQQLWMERMSQDGTGTIATAVSGDQVVSDKNYMVTEWAVIQDDAEIEITAVKACDDKEPAHTRK